MTNRYGDFVVPSTDGRETIIKRKDIIESLVMRWGINGLACEKAEECLADVETSELVEWLAMAVLDIMPTCPLHQVRPIAAAVRLPDNIQN